MKKIVSSVAILAMLSQGACSTAGGMYSAGDPTNGDFSVWKTAGAVLLGVVTLGVVGAAAYAGASNSGGGGTTYVDSDVDPVFVRGDSYSRTYYYKGQYITCNRLGSHINCY